eukprot:SAG11_NODE_17087_length_529_cov_0.623256_1_plen_85_part_00
MYSVISMITSRLLDSVSWRNSVYSTSTTYWETAGYDDRAWESAADRGGNGVAPWYHRDGINNNAHWIWTNGAEILMRVGTVSAA